MVICALFVNQGALDGLRCIAAKRTSCVRVRAFPRTFWRPVVVPGIRDLQDPLMLLVPIPSKCSVKQRLHCGTCQVCSQSLSQGWRGFLPCPQVWQAFVRLVPFRIHALKTHSGMPESAILGPVCDFWGSWGRKMRGDHLALCIPGGLDDVTTGTFSVFLCCAWFICTVTKYLFKLMIVFK